MTFLENPISRHFFEAFITFLNVWSPIILEFLCLAFKAFLLFFLYRNVSISEKKNKTFLYLLVILSTGLFTNFTLIINHLASPEFSFISPLWFNTITRSEFITLMLQVYVFLCLARDLSSKRISRKILIFFAVPSIIFTLYFVYWVYSTYFLGAIVYSKTQGTIILLDAGFRILVGFITLLIVYRNYRIEKLNILRHHIASFGSFIFVYWLVKIFESDFFAPTHYFGGGAVVINFSASTVTSIILTVITYFCARKLVGVRFLNMESHVSSKRHEKFNFIYDFKDVLGKLGVVATVKDTIPVTKRFLTQAFDIPEGKVSLIIRERFNKEKSVLEELVSKRSLYIEKVFSSNTDNADIVSFVNKNKIIIRDEVEFTNFYNALSDGGDNLKNVIEFLKTLNADIFLPVYSDSKLVAAIVVDRDARPNRFYTDVERDEMLIYCDYLGSVLYLLTHMNLDTVLQQQRSLQTEVYKKNKILSLFKKGVYSFFENSKKQGVGVLTYKNKRFAYCNQLSREIVPIDLNYDKGLDVTQKLTQLAGDVATFFTPKHVLINGVDEEKIVVDVTPNLERNNTILTVSGPRMADLIGKQLLLLKDPSKWATLLALKSTPEGKLVDHLLPADTQTLLNTKVSFFEHATTSRVLLFEMPSKEDAYAFASVVHKINNRRVFETVKVEYGDNGALAQKIFGVNPIFEHEHNIGLLESLHKRGTLFIRNIHLLSLDVQRRLLDFIKSGKYVSLKSDEHKESDVLLLFSTSRNLFDLVAQGVFLKELYLELRKGTMWLPTLSTLSNDEFLALAEGVRGQVVYSKLYQNLLVFNESDKKKLFESGCVSLHELKTKVQNIVLKKTKRQSLKEAVVIDPASTVSDLDLAAAARLGRHALKDPKTLALLMKKFKNSQSRIALFLGVNRSTVSRRCSQYNIKTDSH